MSQTILPLAPPPHVAVLQRLDRLRWRILVHLGLAGLSRLAWLVLALAALDFLLDRTFRFDLAQRAVLLVLAAGMIAYLAVRWLIGPLLQPLSDEMLALEVERVHPRLRQSLITAVQLAKSMGQPRRGLSPALMRRAIEEGTRLSESVAFSDVLDHAAYRRHATSLALAVVVFATAAVAGPLRPGLRTWLARNVLLREAKWPQRTYLSIENLRAGGVVVVPRGSDWTQFVTVRDDSSEIPQEAYLDVQGPRGVTIRPLTLAGPRRFSADFARVLEPFRFRARGGDDVTGWVTVELVDPPELTSIRLFARPPRYTGTGEQELSAGQGPYLLLPGSAVRFVAQANKDLERATLVARGRLLKGNDSPETAVSFPLSFQAGLLEAAIAADQVIAGEYRVELVDGLGFREREPISFILQERADQPPQLNVRLLHARGIATPEARLAYEVHVQDDFGLSDLTASLRWQAPAEAIDGEHNIDLSGHLAQARVPVGEPAASREARFGASLDLASLNLIPRTSVQIEFTAQDNNDVTGPATARSSELIVRIVSPDELRVDLLRREKELRQQFEQLVKQQEAQSVESHALTASAAHSREATADLPASLAAIQSRQREVRRGTLSIAERFSAIADEVEANRLEDENGKLLARLRTQIAQPLVEVANDELAVALAELDHARLAASGEARRSALMKAREAQNQAARDMKTVLRLMVESESFQEALHLLHEIQRAQTQVHDETNRVRQERIQRLLEGQGKASGSRK